MRSFNALAGFLFLLALAATALSTQLTPPKTDCPVEIRQFEVSGQSMAELFPAGSQIEAQFGYYACHPVRRDDIVLIEIPGRGNRIVKQVRVIPGDRFELKQQTNSPDYQLRVNGWILKTPLGHPYAFRGARARMLKLYEDQFQGRMPAETYLVFGSEVLGSFDSTKFGPVTLDRVKAKVLRK